MSQQDQDSCHQYRDNCQQEDSRQQQQQQQEQQQRQQDSRQQRRDNSQSNQSSEKHQDSLQQNQDNRYEQKATQLITGNSAILYHKDRVTIIDIPTSISEAQGTPASPWDKSLLSSSPITTPYPSHEPKSEAARAKLRAKMATENDAIYADLIVSSLATIRDTYDGPWCLQRSHVSIPLTPLPEKRKAHSISADSIPSENEDLLHQLSMLSSSAESYSSRWQDLHHQSTNQPPLDTFVWPRYLCNSFETSRILHVLSASKPDPTSFFIPPGAAFYLGDCSVARPFHLAVRDVAHQLETPRQFDLIIMDPPWPNASVKRTEKSGRSAYQVSPTIWDVRQLVFEMDIDVLLANEGMIAIWITNKQSVRELVLGQDGFFESWGVQLEEEWLWIKTTLNGDPVSAPDALWRKPYEVLLIGRKREPNNNDQHDNPTENQNLKVERRVIVGVPDLHSRKPCLKQLFDRFELIPPNHRTLEVFARYLVADWWSWGNQVLKFNNEDCWLS